MHLYAGHSSDFVTASAHNQVAKQLQAAFRSQFKYDAPISEQRSWRESLRALSQVIVASRLCDHGVLLEYQLPLSSKRLDCLITGHDEHEQSSAVIVEIKQWEASDLTEGEGLVRTCLAGKHTDVLHPSVQANQYRRYLADMHEAFSGEGAIRLSACAYLPNYHLNGTDPILANKFSDVANVAPSYTADVVPSMVRFLRQRLAGGRGLQIMERIESGYLRPSRNPFISFDSNPSDQADWSELRTEHFPFKLACPTLDTCGLSKVIEEIIASYKHLIEYRGIWKLLYATSGKPLHEHVGQKVFFVVADAYCKANNIDITPEAHAGRGRVDFKLSQGYHSRAVVELKLSTNPHLVHGYAEQLEAYKRGECTDAGYLVVLYVGAGEKQLDAIASMALRARFAGKPHSRITVIDATRKPYASRF